MKVKDLIKELEKLDLEEEITITYDSLPLYNGISIYHLKKDLYNENDVFKTCYMMTCQDYSDVKGHKQEKMVFSNREFHCWGCYKDLKFTEIKKHIIKDGEWCENCFKKEDDWL